MGATAKEFHIASHSYSTSESIWSPREGRGFQHGHKSHCCQSQRNSAIFWPSSKLFLLLSVTSQLGANVCGLPAPVFLRSPRAMNTCSLYSTHWIPQHYQVFLETIKGREWVLHSSSTLPQRSLTPASGGWRRKLWEQGREKPQSLEVFLND